MTLTPNPVLSGRPPKQAASLSLALAALSPLAFSACGGSSGGGGAPLPLPAGSIAGTFSYERAKGTKDGLDYDNLKKLPIRGAVVQLLNATTKAILAKGVTSDTGTYKLSPSGTGPVIVRVLAETASPKITVQDNKNGNAVYTSDSPTVQATGKDITGQNFTVSLGLKANHKALATKKYEAIGGRASAPFAILDNCYQVTKMIVAARPNLKIPDCKMNWSSQNPGKEGSFYDPGAKQVTLGGEEDVDTDEFDEHTVVHEWGHFFEDLLSRSDSDGGDHRAGELLQPPFAFGEGWGYGIAGIGTHPDTLNAEVSGPGQNNGDGAFDIETLLLAANGNSADPKPGWFSEFTVAGLFYDLFDPGTDPGKANFDDLELPLGAILDVMTGPQKNTASETSIFSFIHHLKTANPTLAAKIDKITGQNAAVIQPVQDEIGTGETNNGGFTFNLPVYTTATVGGPALVLKLHGTAGSQVATEQANKLPANRLIRFVGNGASITVTATTTPPAGKANDHDIRVDLFLRTKNGVVQPKNEQEIGTIDDVRSGTETAAFPSVNGAVYLLRIADLGDLNGTYDVTVTLK